MAAAAFAPSWAGSFVASLDERSAVLTKGMCDWIISAFDPTRDVVTESSP